MLKYLTDSGFGIDACPYPTWARAPSRCIAALLDAYQSLGTRKVCGETLLALFEARLISIQEGIEDGDGDNQHVHNIHIYIYIYMSVYIDIYIYICIYHMITHDQCLKTLLQS